MNPATAILWIAAAVMFGWGPALCLALAVRNRIDRHAEDKRRAEQNRETTPEWLALIAAVEPTPVYDALVCEQMERAEGWVS